MNKNIPLAKPLIFCFLALIIVIPAQAQLYFGPSITHTSSREWNNSSQEYTTNDFDISLHYQFKRNVNIQFGASSIIRQGDNRSTEFIRFPLLFQMSIEEFSIDDRQLWRLYFATGGFLSFPVNSNTDESLIDYYSFGAIGEIGMAFNFTRGAFATIGYRATVDFDSVKRSDAAIPQRFADSGIQLGFYMPFSIFSRKVWKEKEPYL